MIKRLIEMHDRPSSLETAGRHGELRASSVSQMFLGTSADCFAADRIL